MIDELNKIKSRLNYESAVKIMNDTLAEKTVSDFVISVIKDRLYNEGVDSNDDKLRTDWGISQGTRSGYSKSTEKSKDTNHVTLYDTGAMYDTIIAKAETYGIEILANFNLNETSIYDNFQDSYRSEKDMKDKVLSLSESDIEILIGGILGEKFIENYKKYILS